MILGITLGTVVELMILSALLGFISGIFLGARAAKKG